MGIQLFEEIATDQVVKMDGLVDLSSVARAPLQVGVQPSAQIASMQSNKFQYAQLRAEDLSYSSNQNWQT